VDTKGADSVFKNLVQQQAVLKEKAVFYTRENGGVKQHTQPLSLGKTIREGI